MNEPGSGFLAAARGAKKQCPVAPAPCRAELSSAETRTMTDHRGPHCCLTLNHSTITEVHGDHKQGADYGYTRQFGATRYWQPERAPARCSISGVRKGSATNSGRRAERFVTSLVVRAGPAAPGRRPCGLTRRSIRQADQSLPTDRAGVIHRCQPEHRSPGGHRADPRAELDAHRVSRRWPGRSGRDQVPGDAPDRAPAPAWSARRPSSDPTGATTASSPTGSGPPSTSMPTTAAAPSSSSPSTTSKKVPGSAIARRGNSSPTPPGP